ncbi:hypothetical protein LL240_11390 [Oceanimonas baumannii]|uniref:hypothetical protein n=1 Tax=Oceanimonas baumannii TaxID=129578 RepID=UPI001D18C4CF|nr:hypothetical protein [Oceanimonas baumannii]MCC4265050.1 hypothetical protein [Oceanimonas baumannii]
MLVYVNNFSFIGNDAKDSVLSALKGWFKQKVGRPVSFEEIQRDSEITGETKDGTAWLKTFASVSDEESYYSWVLKHSDGAVRGRQWITELGMRVIDNNVEFSCMVQTDEQSILVNDPVKASRPRIIQYVVDNIDRSENSTFKKGFLGKEIKIVGKNIDEYRSLRVDIERRDRKYPIILVSPNYNGNYSINIEHLQSALIGLAQVVKIDKEFNSYDMEEFLGREWSAWDGAINILETPRKNGFVRGRLLLSDTIYSYGETQTDRVAHLMGLVTHNTNIPKLRNRIRSDGVKLLSMRKRLSATRQRLNELSTEDLKSEVDDLWGIVEAHDTQVETMKKEYDDLEGLWQESLAKNDQYEDDLSRKEHEIRGLKQQLSNAAGVDVLPIVEPVIKLASSQSSPTPEQCINTIESAYSHNCVILDSAYISSKDVPSFTHGRRLLDMLRRLVTDYRSKMIEGGDNLAKDVFTPKEYSAKESESTSNNKSKSSKRTFEYNGKPLFMERHLKVGVSDNTDQTIRVYFYWDSDEQKIVIGYCGEHLPISSK